MKPLLLPSPGNWSFGRSLGERTIEEDLVRQIGRRSKEPNLKPHRRWLVILSAAALLTITAPLFAESGSNRDIAAVAPGRTVPGEAIRIYGQHFLPEREVSIAFSRGPSSREILFEGVAQSESDHSVKLQLPPDLPPGRYWLAARFSREEHLGPWTPALEVVPPTWGLPPEDPLPSDNGAIALAQPLTPGQVVMGSWSGPGETDFFLLTTGAGARFDLSLERVDTSLSIFHPKSVDPELMIASPDGLICGESCYSDNISAANSDARIEGYEPAKPGVYLVICRTSRGAGPYRLTVTRTRTASEGDFKSIPFGFPVLNIASDIWGEAYISRWLVFDPRGAPAGGVTLNWEIDGGHIIRKSVSQSQPNGITWAAVKFKADNATVRATFPWPWFDQGNPDTRADHGGLRGGIIAHANFDASGTVYFLKSTGGRPDTLQMREPRPLSRPETTVCPPD